MTRYIRLLGVLWVCSVIRVNAQDLPSETVTPTETGTIVVSVTSTPLATTTPTLTASPTPTLTPTTTVTPVIQTVVVTQPPVVITLPPLVITQPAVIITQPPIIITEPAVVMTNLPPITAAPITGLSPLPTQLTPFYGWQRYQSIHFIAVVGTWGIENDPTASARQYRATRTRGAIARYPFTGDGVRLRYRTHPNGCRFEIAVDNVVLTTLDSGSAEEAWVLTDAYFLTSGYHVFDIRSLASADNTCGVAFDYIEVFVGPPPPNGDLLNPLSALPTTESVQDVAQVVLLSSPPTPLPPPTQVPTAVIYLVVQLAYDANANGVADLGEGIQGVSVRIAQDGSGALLTSGVTDGQGRVQFQIVTRDAVTVSLPFLARTLTLRPVTGRTTDQNWNILLDPANQPAVIP